IATRQFAIDGSLTLTPKTFGTLAAFTRETFEHSLPTIESTVRVVLTESVGHALDTAMFSNTAADATRPAGLLLGIGATSAATAADLAMLSDLETLAAAVAPVAANSPILFVASPKQARRMQYSAQLKDVEVFASSALADKTVIAIASNSLASAIDPAP